MDAAVKLGYYTIIGLADFVPSKYLIVKIICFDASTLTVEGVFAAGSKLITKVKFFTLMGYTHASEGELHKLRLQGKISSEKYHALLRA